MKLFSIIFTGAGLLFMAIGGTLAWHQHRTIGGSVPVEAIVLSTDIEQHTSSSSNGGSSTTYKPIVRYQYQFDGVEYECDNVHPISSSSSHNWARSIVKQFPVGQKVEAYCNPRNPRKAFLIRRHDFFPYVFILFPAIFVCIGIGVGVSSGASKVKPPLPLPSTGGWFEVKPTARIADRQRAALLGMVLWDSIGFLACGHFFIVAERPYGLFAIIATGIYGLIGCVPLGMVIYYGRLRQTIADARLFLMGSSVKRGEKVTIGARQAVLDQLNMEIAELGFSCQVSTKTQSGGKTTYSSHTGFEELKPVLENHRAHAGENLEYAAELTIPESEHPSTQPKSKGYPRYLWRISLRVKIANGPDYRANFPVNVE